MKKFISTNAIQLHYLDYDGDGETLLLMHGLTANAHSFDGLAQAGLQQQTHFLSVDLRGRGLSDQPMTGYTMADHARDIVGMLDALGLEQVTLGGHSFGRLLTLYIAAHYPARVKKMVLMDAGILHPQVRDLIKPSLARLELEVPTWEVYLNTVKNSAYFHDGFWDAGLENYYRADVEMLPNGAVRSRCKPHNIAEAVEGVLSLDWPAVMSRVEQPAILLRAPEGVGPAGTPPIITEEGAQQTRQHLKNCVYQEVTGNHITMLFGKHAPNTAQAILGFLER